MKRKYIGDVSKRYSVFKHVSQWDGNFRCHVWALQFESDNKEIASNFYHALSGGYYELRDHTENQLLSATV